MLKIGKISKLPPGILENICICNAISKFTIYWDTKKIINLYFNSSVTFYDKGQTSVYKFKNKIASFKFMSIQ